MRIQEETEASRAGLVETLDFYPFEIDERLFERFSETRTGYNQLPRDLGRTLHVEARKQNMEIGEADLKAMQKAMDDMVRRLEPKVKRQGPGLLPDISIPGLPEKSARPGPEHSALLTGYTKAVARVAGADLVGVAPFDARWIYSQQQLNPYMASEPVTKEIRIADALEPEETQDAVIIPSDAASVVVCAFGMDKPLDSTAELMLTQGWLSGSHIRMGVAAVAVAEFIRKQGYWAMPDSNRLGHNVPMAVLAGIGEAGRNGLLVTPELGSYLRLSKVITNMPLRHDKPVRFGVREYCSACFLCAESCPSGAITGGPQGWSGENECNNHGAFKWYNNYKKCISHWMKSGKSCANCILSCPFTKKRSDKNISPGFK
jgi:reductive dehalogenase